MAALTATAYRTSAAAHDRRGTPRDLPAAAEARARRDRAGAETYTALLAPHADVLIAAARKRLRTLVSSPYAPAWTALVDGLATSHATIAHALEHPAPPGSTAEREQHRTLWPHLAAWSDHSHLLDHLTEPPRPPGPELAGEHQRQVTERARAASRRGDLDLVESWYTDDGRLITLAHLPEPYAGHSLVALAGDPGVPGWTVIGHYPDDATARQTLPRPAPPGVLRPTVSRSHQPDLMPEQTLQDLLTEVVLARSASDVADVLLTATHSGYEAGPLPRLQQLIDTAAQFAAALETAHGRQISARLGAAARQLAFLHAEIHEAAEDLDATVAVLPPHRVPRTPPPPRPTPDTTPPPLPPRAPTQAPAHHR
ncbi:hypothetical protein [Streptomyces acidiscabies]|uniref:Uncharacterized protein n=3 Tax=Streptomyces acidiscabies TaxID=42234 RepID=A0AAP6BJK3_9ACTN|nr:hypothetical protein [Streptomyces acidiscabies]MDX2965647.1 hypothetical protein [Streptomyces acidiscabies]MDX3024851.1 hypothetical protein [Streptomyces acidiscabies]MDX3795563.1 hypothetical protein [Streptomyces acidiscabies]